MFAKYLPVIGCVGIGVFVATLVIWNPLSRFFKETTQTREQFATELAETNRQADVASQLRAAERGDLIKMRNGAVAAVWREVKEESILLAWGSCNESMTEYPLDLLSRRADEVMKYYPPSPKYAEVAAIYIRCERVK